ncbi:YjgN family protein [Ruegeria arenilitoris]|uniref:YjgN family protein n=1 Tax=Ruegeria arenilitoris TaxID=1173585 RepID=UPI00147D87D2|nr:YjgN family protein [Ruegeria arenilitoris]
MQADHRQEPPAEFEFRGSAAEYFGIWIVNLLLSLLTFGIYSAWAKVRTKKYFYQNTFVAGRSFDYHATGLQILIGRIIVIAGIVAYTILGAIPLVNLAMLLGLVFLIPYLLVRSLRFQARMSSWSNVRFDFQGNWGTAAANYFLYPFLAALTIYTTWPFVTRSVQRFHVNGHTFGTTKMSFDSPIGPFYKAALAAMAWGIGTIVIATVVVGVNVNMSGMLSELSHDPEDIAAMIDVIMILLLFFVAAIPATIIYRAMVRNTVYNYTILGDGHRFYSDVSALRLLWISVSNAVVVAMTLGLMLPWAHVRRVRYLANHTLFIPAGPLDDFVGDISAQVSAIGDAYGDIEGFDIGIAV